MWRKRRMCLLGRRVLGWWHLEPAPHIQLRTDLVRISRAYAEPDVLMPDRIPALLADHPADDAVTILVMTQRDRRTAPAVQPLIPPGQHRRQDREEVPAHLGQQVLIARRIVLVEPLGHDPRVHQLAQPD